VSVATQKGRAISVYGRLMAAALLCLAESRTMFAALRDDGYAGFAVLSASIGVPLA